MIVKIDKVTKAYNKKLIIDNFSYTFTSGYYCIMGASGIGKTTLLNLISGLVLPDSGIITVDGRIGFCFQENRLLEHLSAIKNIKLVVDNDVDYISLMAELGLGDDCYKKVRYYSGGMKRRLALLRALVNQHPIILLDEPFKELDEYHKKLAIAFIKKYTANAIVIVVTHDLVDASLLDAQVINI